MHDYIHHGMAAMPCRCVLPVVAAFMALTTGVLFPGDLSSCARGPVVTSLLAAAQVPSAIVKKLSREVSALVESFTHAYSDLVGAHERVCVVDVAADGHHLVAHTKAYIQVGMT